MRPTMSHTTVGHKCCMNPRWTRVPLNQYHRKAYDLLVLFLYLACKFETRVVSACKYGPYFLYSLVKQTIVYFKRNKESLFVYTHF